MGGARYARFCAAGGVFLIDVMGKEVLARVFLPVTESAGEDGALLIQRQEIRADWTRIYSEWIFLKEGRTRTLALEHTVYSGWELRELLLEAGFAGVRLYGNLAGDVCDSNARRLVAVATKD